VRGRRVPRFDRLPSPRWGEGLGVRGRAPTIEKAMNSDRRLIEFARRMRREPSPTEELMWKLLRNQKLGGFRFRRQHPFPPYIADFYCAVARLVIEADGESHLESKEYDSVRQTAFEARGLRVLRFWNTTVFDDSEAVLETIYRVCIDRAKEDERFGGRLDQWGQFQRSPQKLTE